jgi:GT2 family glycosyltransferase
MSSGVEVIIPVVMTDLADGLLNTIATNTIQPDNIIIIDNASTPYTPVIDGYMGNLEIRRSGRLMGVSESWNLGKACLSHKAKYVSILNDDILLKPTFFEKNINLLTALKQRAVVACPIATDKLEEFYDAPEMPNPAYIRMIRREGFAFTIPKSVFDSVPLIPLQFGTFFGDDWIWTFSKKGGKSWFKDLSNVVWHKKGASIKKLGLKNLPRLRRPEFVKIRDELIQEMEVNQCQD